MDTSCSIQVNTWLVEYIYESVWAYFDADDEVPLALRFMIDGCLNLEAEKVVGDSPDVEKMLCVLKCLLLTLNAESIEADKQGDPETYFLEELLGHYCTLEDGIEIMQEFISKQAVEICIRDKNYDLGGRVFQRVAPFLSPRAKTNLRTALENKRLPRESMSLEDFQAKMVRHLRNSFGPRKLLKNSGGKSFLMNTAETFLKGSNSGGARTAAWSRNPVDPVDSDVLEMDGDEGATVRLTDVTVVDVRGADVKIVDIQPRNEVLVGVTDLQLRNEASTSDSQNGLVNGQPILHTSNSKDSSLPTEQPEVALTNAPSFTSSIERPLNSPIKSNGRKSIETQSNNMPYFEGARSNLLRSMIENVAKAGPVRDKAKCSTESSLDAPHRVPGAMDATTAAGGRGQAVMDARSDGIHLTSNHFKRKKKKVLKEHKEAIRKKTSAKFQSHGKKDDSGKFKLTKLKISPQMAKSPTGHGVERPPVSESLHEAEGSGSDSPVFRNEGFITKARSSPMHKRGAHSRTSGTEGDAENEGDGDVGNDRKESSPRKKKCNGIKIPTKSSKSGQPRQISKHFDEPKQVKGTDSNNPTTDAKASKANPTVVVRAHCSKDVPKVIVLHSSAAESEDESGIKCEVIEDESGNRAGYDQSNAGANCTSKGKVRKKRVIQSDEEDEGKEKSSKGKRKVIRDKSEGRQLTIKQGENNRHSPPSDPDFNPHHEKTSKVSNSKGLQDSSSESSDREDEDIPETRSSKVTQDQPIGKDAAGLANDVVKRHQWTYDESVNIWKGVQKYGEGNWSKIMEVFKFHSSRTNVTVKDRWRTMVRMHLDKKIAREQKQ